MGKTAGRARFARIGIAVAVLVVLAGIGVALAMTVGGLAPAGGSNALVVEEARLKSSAPSSPMPPASRCSCAASPPTVWPGILST